MKDHKICDCLVIILLNFCIIVFGIWISAIPITKSEKFYLHHFEENTYAQKVLESEYDVPGIEIMKDVMKITIDYYFGNAEEYQVYIGDEKLFNEDEVRHMKDVKNLYVIGQIIAIICLMLMIASFFYLIFHFRRIKKRLIITTICFYGGIIILVGAFFIWGLFSYYQADPIERSYNSYFVYLFINFHHLIFPNLDKFYLATGQNGYDIRTLTTILNSDLFMNAGIIIAIVTVTCIILWVILIIVVSINHQKICQKVDEVRAKNLRTRTI